MPKSTGKWTGIGIEVRPDTDRTTFKKNINDFLKTFTPSDFTNIKLVGSLDKAATEAQVKADIKAIEKNLSIPINLTGKVSQVVDSTTKSKVKTAASMSQSVTAATSKGQARLDEYRIEKQTLETLKLQERQRQTLNNLVSASTMDEQKRLQIIKDQSSEIALSENRIKELRRARSLTPQFNAIDQEITGVGLPIADEKVFNQMRGYLMDWQKTVSSYNMTTPGSREYQAAGLKLDELKEKMSGLAQQYQFTAEQASNFNAILGAQASRAGDITRVLTGASSLSDKMNTYFKLNTKFQGNNELLAQFKDMQERANQLGQSDYINKIGVDNARRELSALNNEFRTFQTDVKAAGLAGKTFGERLRGMFEKFGGWTIVTRTLAAVIRYLKQMAQAVVEVDTAMTELRKVTNETEDTYTRFLDNAAQRAQKLGTSLVDTINATADVARLGYNIQEAEGITDSIILFGNVADGLESIDEASEGIISTLQAFRHEWQDAGMTATEYSQLIADKYNEIGNNFAISSGGVSEALLRSSAALASANNTLDESIALAAAANTTIQNPEKVGTALKTVSMYIRAARQEAEEAGIATDGMAKSVASLRKDILTLTNQKVDIMLDESTFKSTYQIIKELSLVWDELADVDQAAITKMLGGGVRNGNVINALIQNFDIAEQALEKSANAAGSAMEENEKYLNSIQGKISKLKATFQDFARNFFSGDMFKSFIDLIRNILTSLNNVAQYSVIWETMNKAVAGLVNILNDLFNVINKILEGFGKLPKASQWALILGTGLIVLLKNLSAVRVAVVGIIMNLQSLRATGMLIGAQLGLSFGPFITALGAAAAAIGVFAIAYHSWSKSMDEFKDKIEENNKEIEKNQQEISDYQAQISEAQQKVKDLSSGNISSADSAVIAKLNSQISLYETQVKVLEIRNEKLKEFNRLNLLQDIRNTGGTRYDAFTGEEASKWQIYGAQVMDFLSGIPGLGKLFGDGNIESTVATTLGDAFNFAKSTGDIQTMTKLVGEFQQRLEVLGEYSSSWSAEEKQIWAESVTNIYDWYNAVNESGQAYVFLANTVGLSADKITGASSKSELEDMISSSSQLQFVLHELGITTEDFANELWNNKDAISEAAESLKDYNAIAKELNEDIDSLQSHINTLNSAQEEFNNTGRISIDTLQQMMSDYPELIDLIADYIAGNVTAQEVLSKYKDAYEADGNSFADLINSKLSLQEGYLSAHKQTLETYLQEFNRTYQTELTNVSSIEAAKEAVKKRHLSGYFEAYKSMSEQEMQIELMKARAMKAVLTLMNTTARIMSKVSKVPIKYDASDAIANLSAQEQALGMALSGIGSLNANFGGAGGDILNNWASSGSGSGSGGGGSSSSNPEFNAQYDALKHKRDMDLITEKEYLDALEKLYKRYFKQGTSDWNKYELEVYKGRKSLQEQAEKDALEQQRNAFNAEYELLKHKLDMEVIEEREYYDKLEKLYKKYFTKSSDDWRKYEEEVYKGREKLRQQAASDIKDLLDLVEKYIRQTKQDEIDALKKQIDAYKELADLRKDALDKLKDEADYTKTVAEKRRQVADIEMRLERAKLDTSASGRKNQLQLEEELSKARDDLAEYEYDHSIELQKEAIDKELEAETAKAQAKIDILEAYLNNQNQVISDAWTMLNGMSNELYQNLINWNATYGTGVERDVTDKWKAAGDALDYYGSKVRALQTYESLLAKQSADDCEMIADAAVGATGKATGASTSSSKSSASSSVSSSNASVAASNAAAAASKAASEGAAASAKSVTAATITGAQSAVNKLFDATKKAVSDAAASAINNIQISYVHSGGGNGGSLAFNMKKLQVKAAGDKYIPRSTDYITQEAGGELIFHKGGVITPLAQGDMVFNNEATRRLWELANNPNSNWIVGGIAKTLGNMLDSAPVRGTKGNAGVTASIVFGDMIVNGNADENVLRQFRDNIVNDVTKSLNDIYFRKGYAAIPRSSF